MAGSSQLFGPPRASQLAAITPLSVDRQQRRPPCTRGGDLNTGSQSVGQGPRHGRAKPASPPGGQPWALTQIRKGDQTCGPTRPCTQRRRSHRQDPANRLLVPTSADPLAPGTFVRRSPRRVFWPASGGRAGRAALSKSRKSSRAPARKWFPFTNGTPHRSLVHRRIKSLVRLSRALRRASRPWARPRAPKGPRTDHASAAAWHPGVTSRTTRFQSQPTYAACARGRTGLPEVRSC